jgi:cob(I)alamin adenosyltransferase
MKGLFHIYTGEGKGKTTAALGLALRAYGRGLKILYCQFLKSGNSGEHQALVRLQDLVQFVKAPPLKGFFNDLAAGERERVCGEQRRLFTEVAELAMTGEYDLLIMDEAVVAYNLGILRTQEVEDFIKGRPEKLELVITGRGASEHLIALADYVSEIVKVKHPYDRGIKMRKGIEF